MQKKWKQTFTWTSFLRNKAVTGLVSLCPSANFLRKHTRVGTYICVYLFSEMSYAIGSSAYFFFFFSRNALEGPSLSVHKSFFFFFNNGIIFHPKEASCFIYPSATARHLGLPPILELHAEHQSPLRFTVSGHTLPLSRIWVTHLQQRWFSFSSAPLCASLSMAFPCRMIQSWRPSGPANSSLGSYPT